MIEIRDFYYFKVHCHLIGKLGYKDIFEMKEQLYAQMMGWV